MNDLLENKIIFIKKGTTKWHLTITQ
jgi:hypothetical protein